MQIPSKKFIASFDVDPQKTFTPLCPEELPVPEGTEIVKELNAQAQFAAVRVGSKDAHSPQAHWVADEKHPMFTPIHAENMNVYWKQHAVPGTKGFEYIDGLPLVTDYDYMVWKGVELHMHPYGACYHDIPEKMSTGVIEFLKFREISHVIVGGLATDYCVYHTVLQLLKAGFKVIVNKAACRGIAEDSTNRAYEHMQQAGAKTVSSSKELQQAIGDEG